MSINLNGKTYLELSHKEPLSIEEIRSLYDGYWVYVVNAEFADGSRSLIKGIPVVIGTMAFAGSEDGIYKKYKVAKYAPRKEVILLNDNFISGLVFC
jgi:hypothetical protein